MPNKSENSPFFQSNLISNSQTNLTAFFETIKVKEYLI